MGGGCQSFVVEDHSLWHLVDVMAPYQVCRQAGRISGRFPNWLNLSGKQVFLAIDFHSRLGLYYMQAGNAVEVDFRGFTNPAPEQINS